MKKFTWLLALLALAMPLSLAYAEEDAGGDDAKKEKKGKLTLKLPPLTLLRHSPDVATPSYPYILTAKHPMSSQIVGISSS